MGLREEIQSEVAAAFNEDLADAVRQFVLTRKVSAEPYSPLKGKVKPGTPLEFPGRGVFSRFKEEQVDGQTILATDERLLVLQNEIDTKPEIGDDVDGKRVMNVWQDPAAVTWIAQLRRA